MKKQTKFLAMMVLPVLMIVCSGIPSQVSAANQAAIDAIVAGNNCFAFDLYSAIANEKGNLFFSPYSISSALAMTYAGARGETAKQMGKTFHFDLATTQLNSGFSELMKRFNASGKSYQLSVANALWGQQGTEFYPEFTRIVKNYYDAGFDEVDYINHTKQARMTINNWVEKKTKHKIMELIKPKVLDNLTRLVLTNAIYFKGRWKLQFKPENTKEATFYTATNEKPKVPLMYQVGKFKYVETDQLQILELPYSGGEIAMDILLPKPQSDLTKLESNLHSVNFESWLDKMSMKQVDVFLPRFKLEKRDIFG